MSERSVYIGSGLSYDKVDGTFSHWDNTTASYFMFHRSMIGTIQSHSSKDNNCITFNNKNNFTILNLKVKDQKELRDIITIISNPDLEIFKNHNLLTKEDLLCLLESIQK